MNHHEHETYGRRRSELPSGLEPLLTVAGVARILAVSRPTVYRLVRAGALRPIAVGARKRFALEEVRRFLTEHQAGSTSGRLERGSGR